MRHREQRPAEPFGVGRGRQSTRPERGLHDDNHRRQRGNEPVACEEATREAGDRPERLAEQRPTGGDLPEQLVILRGIGSLEPGREYRQRGTAALERTAMRLAVDPERPTRNDGTAGVRKLARERACEVRTRGVRTPGPDDGDGPGEIRQRALERERAGRVREIVERARPRGLVGRECVDRHGAGLVPRRARVARREKLTGGRVSETHQRVVPSPSLSQIVAILVVLALVMLGARIEAYVRKMQERARGREAVKRGLLAEQTAEEFLKSQGYKLIGRHAPGSYALEVDGAQQVVHVKADRLLEKGGKKVVAEVKTGKSAKLDNAETRRQILEYQLAFGVESVLLVDMEARTMHTVRFPLPIPKAGSAPAAPPPTPAKRANRRWLKIAAVGVVLAWWIARPSDAKPKTDGQQTPDPKHLTDTKLPDAKPAPAREAKPARARDVKPALDAKPPARKH